jgi:hypothetical protein
MRYPKTSIPISMIFQKPIPCFVNASLEAFCACLFVISTAEFTDFSKSAPP